MILAVLQWIGDDFFIFKNIWIDQYVKYLMKVEHDQLLITTRY
jgi:hypothetical protein